MYSIGNTYAAPCYISAFGESFALLAHEGGVLSAPVAYTVSAFPNPFNPATSLYYQLANDATILLTIHDISGRYIATLVEGEKVAGYHTVRWLGEDEAHRKAASGVYFYRFTAIPLNGQKVIQRSGKLLLTK